ncbi:MAG: fumarylacetoacetase, partial [Bacteroidota bacterium]|nr:fumarylacetoacetase [Bacteroidota bacterium]
MFLHANDPSLRSWIQVEPDSDFPIQNIPFGIGTWNDGSTIPVTRIGDQVINLSILAKAGMFKALDVPLEAFHASHLNDLMRSGRKGMRAVRDRLSELFRNDDQKIQSIADLRDRCKLPAHQVSMLLPVTIGDYTDFYSSREHATNVGTMFRDPANALLPNWLHLPVGYHGRASSIIPSGIPIKR